MVSLDDAVIARIRKGGKDFEILVDPDTAYLYKRGELTDVSKILAAEEVFENASAGDRASDSDLMSAFKTTNVLEVSSIILKEGDISLTKEQRKRIIEEKRRAVVTFISQNGINPQTMTPHPPQRIVIAMDEAKVHIDPSKSLDELVNITMKAIRPLIPIRFEEVDVAVKIPAVYAPRAYGDVMNFGKMLKSEWQNDGSLIAVVKIPAGMQTDFYSLLNHLTKGEAETKLLRKDN